MSNAVIYTCPFVPAEWVAAHGLQPLRMSPASTDALPSVAPAPGMCPYARAFAGAAISHADAVGAVATTMCDQMRRAADLIAANSDRPLFLLNVPHTWQTPASVKLYRSEVERLGRFLVRLGGAAPSADWLAEVMLESVRKAPVEPVRRSGAPLALVGGPVFSDHSGIYQLIESAGGRVDLDATETGERGQPAPFDRRSLRDDPLGALCDSYFGTIPDPFRRPNNGFFHWLKNRIEQTGVRGIVVRRYVWCDNWHAEVHRIREWSGLPVLDLDVGDDGLDSARTLARLQAFTETLA